MSVLNPPVKGKIQGFFMPLSVFAKTLQGKFNFQGLFKTVLYIQVLFKPVRTLVKLFLNYRNVHHYPVRI